MFWISNSLDGPSNLSVMLQLGKLNVSVIFVMTFAGLMLGTVVFEFALLARFAEYVSFLQRFQKQYLLSVNVVGFSIRENGLGNNVFPAATYLVRIPQ
jgi:hypothetical protein